MLNLQKEQLFRRLIAQYMQDSIGQQHWPDLDTTDSEAALRTIFTHGACIDFANAVTEATGWPSYEIQWGTAMADDPDDVESDLGLHRVVLHPSGRYFDASGWTDRQAVLTRFNALAFTYQWMDEVDYCSTVFDVDSDLVAQAVMALLPEGAIEAIAV